MIDYKALAERIEAIAKRQIDGARLSAAQENDEQAKRFEERAADLRTVVSLLEGMAEEKPFAWAVRDGWTPTRFSTDPNTPIVGMRRADYVVDALYLRPAPQLQPERQPVSEPTEAQIEAAATVLFHEHGPGDDPLVTAKKMLRAALAAEQPEPTEDDDTDRTIEEIADFFNEHGAEENEPTEAQIEAAAIELFGGADLEYHRSTAERALRAAFAAKEPDATP